MHGREPVHQRNFLGLPVRPGDLGCTSSVISPTTPAYPITWVRVEFRRGRVSPQTRLLTIVWRRTAHSVSIACTPPPAATTLAQQVLGGVRARARAPKKLSRPPRAPWGPRLHKQRQLTYNTSIPTNVFSAVTGNSAANTNTLSLQPSLPPSVRPAIVWARG